MALFIAFVVTFFAGFAGGWAFFKHRADLKAKAEAELKDHVLKIVK